MPKFLSNTVIALALWIGIGFSAGWFLYLTDHGRAGWPLPTPEAAGGFLIYKYSTTTFQRAARDLHWMLSVTGGGLLWPWLLHLTAPFYGGGGRRLHEVMVRFALTGIPIVVLGLLAAVAAWQNGWGYWWSASDWFTSWMSLSRPWDWIQPVYLTTAVGVVIIQLVVYWKSFSVRGVNAVWHILVSGALLAAVSVGSGTLLRLAFREFS
ncbi:MAG: hypothetical protein GY851_07995 [bacterium]|nr:hypothetical protein [bacterium]